MYQLIAILAAAFGFLTGGQPSDDTLPIGTAALHPADAIPPIGDLTRKAPADAIPPIGDVAPKGTSKPSSM